MLNDTIWEDLQDPLAALMNSNIIDIQVMLMQKSVSFNTRDLKKLAHMFLMLLCNVRKVMCDNLPQLEFVVVNISIICRQEFPLLVYWLTGTKM